MALPGHRHTQLLRRHPGFATATGRHADGDHAVAAELANNWALRSWRDVRRGVAPADGALRNSAGHRDAKAATGGLIAMGQPKPLGHSYDRPAKGGITAVEIDIASRWPSF